MQVLAGFVDDAQIFDQRRGNMPRQHDALALGRRLVARQQMRATAAPFTLMPRSSSNWPQRQRGILGRVLDAQCQELVRPAERNRPG